MGSFVCLMGVERETEERDRERGKRVGPGGVFVLLVTGNCVQKVGGFGRVLVTFFF